MSDTPETPPEDEEPEEAETPPHYTLEVQSMRVATSTAITPND